MVALRARDEGGPALRGQLLIYPSTDLHEETASWQENGVGYGMTREDVYWFRKQYLGEASQATHPHVSPSRAESLAALPPALVITAEYDLLRDEGEAYARALQAAGGAAQVTRYDGMHHGFVSGLGTYDQAQTALDEASAWLRVVLGSTPGDDQA